MTTPRFILQDYAFDTAVIVAENVPSSQQFVLTQMQGAKATVRSAQFHFNQECLRLQVPLEGFLGPNPMFWMAEVKPDGLKLHRIETSLRSYGGVIGPPPTRSSTFERIAIATLCYNDGFILQKWIDYYGPIFGRENLYILDDGSSPKLEDIVDGAGCQFLAFPRRSFEHTRLARSAGWIQRLLLETYDIVIYTDCDEMLFTMSGDLGLAEHIRQSFQQDPHTPIRVTGWNVLHDISNEPPLNPDEPILVQRRFAQRQMAFDKPIITTQPISWAVGFHTVYSEVAPLNGLGMLHFRFFDLDFCLNKQLRYRNTEWSDEDIEAGWGVHQLRDDTATRAEFDAFSRAAAQPVPVSTADDTDVVEMPSEWLHQFSSAGI